MILTQQCYHFFISFLFAFGAALMYQAAQTSNYFYCLCRQLINMRFKIELQQKDNRQCQEQDILSAPNISYELRTTYEVSEDMEVQLFETCKDDRHQSKYNLPPLYLSSILEHPAYRQMSFFEGKRQGPGMDIQFSEHQRSSSQHQVENYKKQKDKQAKEQARTRKPEDLAQNISSAITTLIGDLLSKQNNKQFKDMEKMNYIQFLNKNYKKNGQLVLIFAYLYLLKKFADEGDFQLFHNNLLLYLQQKEKKSAQIYNPEARKIMNDKIDAQKKLLNQVFAFRGKFITNFNKLKNLCAPLFTGRQVNLSKQPFEKAQKIQEEIMASRYCMNSKAQKTTTEVQVDFE